MIGSFPEINQARGNMKIGDMVVRAYAYRAFIPGIIVDEHIEMIQPEGEDEELFEPYEDHNFVVQWSDGSQSREMDMELDFLEDALNDRVKFAEEYGEKNEE
mgnify:CR=1 FL=1